MSEEVFPWLKSLPLAPEYHPTLSEFQDPISYIFKIEEEASKYGICKIIPPVSSAPKKNIINNLNRSLSARNPDSLPTFTTRQQQIGFCPRKHHYPVQKPVWQSGEVYNVSQFEAKAKAFEKCYLKKVSGSTGPGVGPGGNLKKGSVGLEVETMYWKAQVDKPITVEYANDMPGSAFDRKSGNGSGKKLGKKDNVGEGLSVGDTEWNMRTVSRSKGSLLKFMKEEIPGVTSPMVYLSMLFSWFAWHVEDHDFHSLNYMHMGAGKTWYGVPKDAAVAFEDVIRNHGYGGEINPIVNFATLGEKTTIISPEVLVKAGVPCCRLVQNTGEFVVTFPRAYHSGFSHGFNIGEAANIATPGWLAVARDAAIRRASINVAPMVSHCQLLYDLAVSFSSSVPTSVKPEPRSSRLKDKLKVEGEGLVKRSFLLDIMQNNQLLHILGKGSAILVLPEEFIDRRIPLKSAQSDSDDAVLDKKTMRKFSSSRNNVPSLKNNGIEGKYKGGECDKMADYGIFSCVTCGILCYACVAIIQPTEAAANYLMSADCNGINDLVAATDSFAGKKIASVVDPKSSLGKMPKKTRGGLPDGPSKSTDQVQTIDKLAITLSNVNQKADSSLGLLALAYGDSSDSDDDHDHARADIKVEDCQIFNSSDELQHNGSFKDLNCSRGGSEYEIELSCDEQNRLLDTHKSGKGIFQVESLSMNMPCDEDSSRMHIFCLEHAVEVEKLLRPVGGVNMLLLCHQDYSFLNFEAKLVAKELGTDHSWTDLEFREGNEEDKIWIQSALDTEEVNHGNRDWAVKLGVNLFYSASLSRSPLYSKQMPYNQMIYNAFGHISSSGSIKPKPWGRQKKIVVAGKWCGKVWMANQTHPLLVERDLEVQDETGGAVMSLVNVKQERHYEIETTQVVVSKSSRKRKNIRVESRQMSVKTKFPKVEPSPSPSPPPSEDDLPSLSDGLRQQPRTNFKNKQVRREKETTPLSRITLDQIPRQFDTDSDGESGGGPSTRLRKRVIKAPSKDFGVAIDTKPKRKTKMKKQNETKKVKKASRTVEVSDDEEGDFVCDMEGCNMSFDSKQELMVHQKNICPIEGCEKKFFSHKYLVQHRRVHMDDRPLQCPWKGCKMTFKWAWARTEHIRVHTGARPYACIEDGCGQTFRFVSDFSRHKRKTGHSVKKLVGET
uniref:lysine-specific demethylase REF6 n=1 Tax=Erigeron canadensis TaxID=72917 RepID=UPI001CB972B7|nr:lysine-specific demethylase REF6 [Erigeron canadensis]